MPILLLGTGHVFDLDAAIRDVIESERPTVVALELDPTRFAGLRARAAGQATTASDPSASWIYRKLAKVQESLAEGFGGVAGAEMLAAANAAQAVGAQVALVDRDARLVVKETMRRMRFTERARLAWMLISSPFRRQSKESVEAEIQRYQADPTAYLDEIGRQFPTVRRVLIDERNEHMSAAVRRLSAGGANVVAVVGDGHVDGMAQLLADLAPRTIRLKELRARKPRAAIEWRAGAGRATIGFSLNVESPEDRVRWQ